MQPNKIETDKAKNRIFFCWNAECHKDSYSEFKWEQEYNKNIAVKCPVCKQYHKVTMRIGD